MKNQVKRAKKNVNGTAKCTFLVKSETMNPMRTKMRLMKPNTEIA